MVDKELPIYIAVLYALMFPIVITFFTLFIKYVNKLRLDISDWNMAYYAIFSLVITPISIGRFLIAEQSFRWTYLV